MLTSHRIDARFIVAPASMVKPVQARKGKTASHEHFATDKRRSQHHLQPAKAQLPEYDPSQQCIAAALLLSRAKTCS